jgi:hypothetical protein
MVEQSLFNMVSVTLHEEDDHNSSDSMKAAFSYECVEDTTPPSSAAIGTCMTRHTHIFTLVRWHSICSIHIDHGVIEVLPMYSLELGMLPIFICIFAIANKR